MFIPSNHKYSIQCEIKNIGTYTFILNTNVAYSHKLINAFKVLTIILPSHLA